MATDYSHQCRYCAYCVYTLHETWWCDNLSKDIGSPKRPNKCDKFLFNEIPADNCFGEKVYKPRRKRTTTQPRLFDIPTDKQRAKENNNGKD